MGIFVLVVFFVFVIRLWIVDGPKLPLIFIAMWFLGSFGFYYFELSRYFALAFQAVLTVALVITDLHTEMS